MKCRECKWMYSNETMRELYICVNGKSENLGKFTGILCEDDCKDGEPITPTAEKIIAFEDGSGKCPVCGEKLHTGFMDSNYCHWCGQELTEF